MAAASDVWRTRRTSTPSIWTGPPVTSYSRQIR
jgi:hypothetical protein